MVLSVFTANTNDVRPVQRSERGQEIDKEKHRQKYDPVNINLGFTIMDVSDEPRPQYVICFEIISNQGVKPSLLKRHHSTKYYISTQKEVEVSLLTSLRIEKFAKAHKIVEELLFPAAKDVTCFVGESSAKQKDMI
uniref:Uncharacterized protein n=1 Tax=Timema poppense TaxID=170557 RepID=A0A7R9GVZ3_TIMPO|nr:unnamed protein product [Timema poppensis]